MLTAELSALFLGLLYVAHLAGLEPRDLTALPPLSVLTALGGVWSSIAEFLAYLMLFAAYEVGLLAVLTAIAALLGPDGQARVRGSLSKGRDPAGLRPLIWVTLLGMPAILLGILLFARPVEIPRLLFVTTLIVLTAAQSLRWFTIGDFWRGLRGLDASLREMTRPGNPEPIPEPEPAGPVPTDPPRQRSIGGGGGWLTASWDRSFRGEKGTDATIAS